MRMAAFCSIVVFTLAFAMVAAAQPTVIRTETRLVQVDAHRARQKGQHRERPWTQGFSSAGRPGRL